VETLMAVGTIVILFVAIVLAIKFFNWIIQR
jgi:hypothetical protein